MKNRLFIKIVSLLTALAMLIAVGGFSAYAKTEQPVTEETATVAAEEESTAEEETTKKKASKTTTESTTESTTKKKSKKEKTTAPAEEDSTEETTEETTEEQVIEETTIDPTLTKEELQQLLESQRTELEQKLADSEAQLEEYSEEAKLTQDYIDALDEKIGYINEELNVLDREVAEAQTKLSELDKQIEELEQAINALQVMYDEAVAEYNALQEHFMKTFEAYCLRLRAMYISGTTSVLVALIMSNDISQFLNRFEMVKAVAKSDTELLKQVKAEMAELTNQQDGINAQKAELEKSKGELAAVRAEQKKQQEAVNAKKEEIARKKVTLAEDRAESDRLFAEYAKKAQIYTEFRNEDDELIQQVEDEITALLSGLKAPEEITTAVIKDQNEEDVTGDFEGESELFAGSNAALSLSYPVPGHTGVSQVFGHYRNGRAHTGIDFPCPTGSKVCAAQKGIVITVKRLTYSYGYYVMIYHGTDAKGRKVVTLYAHNSSILVSEGDTVAKGETIAKSGSTGNSTGPHCHFELILDGTKVNPKNYLGS